MTAGIGVMIAGPNTAAGLAVAIEMYVIAIAPEARDGDTYQQDSVGTMTATTTAHTTDTVIVRTIATMTTDTDGIAPGTARDRGIIRQ
jgi:hypothetical protein